MKCLWRISQAMLGSIAICLVYLMGSIVTAASDIEYGIDQWPEEGRGNHRVLLRVTEPAEAVRAHIEWRRRDRQPEQKDIRIYDSVTGKRVTNVIRVDINRVYGDLIFQPQTVPGEYEVYYLPYIPPPTGPDGGGRTLSKVGGYFPPEDTAEPAWLKANALTPQELQTAKWRSLPQAKVLSIQARGEFHRMDPMEVIATKGETDQLLASYPNSNYLLFPEDRRCPIKMFEDLPYRWIENGPSEEFIGQAQPGEYYAFQIGIWATRQNIADLDLKFGDMESAAGKRIPASAFHCINFGGRDWLGRATDRRPLIIGRSLVRPLWISVQIPPDAVGTYSGTISVLPRGAEPTKVNIQLNVDGPLLADGGDSEPWRHSRLRWLDSTLGIDDEVIEPFTPLQLNGNVISLLNRQVRFNRYGLPASIQSNGREILAAPVTLSLESENGVVDLNSEPTQVTASTAATVKRHTTARSDALSLSIASRTEFDGCIEYQAILRAKKQIDLKDIRLEVPLDSEVARYMMGMSKQGGYRPKEWQWKWDIKRPDNMVWLGDFNVGIQLKLCHNTDEWQLFDMLETGVPPSWDNDGKGGCVINEQDNQVVVRSYTGPRRLQRGEELELRFRFLVTPFKPIDPQHWNWRIGGLEGEGSVVHVHHSAREHPYINYPFITVDLLKDLVKRAKSGPTLKVDTGKLSYPAEGNINLDHGSVHIWTELNFDTYLRYNHNLFSLDFGNGDELVFYWNLDDWGMRAFVVKDGKYPAIVQSRLEHWEREQRHVVTLSWGDKISIFADGKHLNSIDYKGILSHSLAEAKLHFHGDAFKIDAIKVTDVPFEEGQSLEPSLDTNTLLLDTFTKWDGGEKTKPEKITAGGHGQLSGMYQADQGQYGQRLHLYSREVKMPPKRVNLYYNTYFLPNHAIEMWALRSLGNEILQTDGVDIYTDLHAADKPPIGYAWLREHLVAGYKPEWRMVLTEGDYDASIATQWLSRWNNYYVEGLQWLMQNTGIDGLYLDGIGYDRELMKRVARVMQRIEPASRINFHSWDQYVLWDRTVDGKPLRVSSANQYMEHFPYISNLWFGEMYDYDAPPDQWLVEISGIPFGLTGEMLNYITGGNPYRGMIYGMTGRFHPSHIAMWRFWDAFGIQDAEMIGYWDPNCPILTDDPQVLATAYVKSDKTLVALASWESEPVDCRLTIDWQKLGLDPTTTKITAPAIEKFQPSAVFSTQDAVPVEAAKGWLLILED